MDSNRSVFYSRSRGHYPLVFTIKVTLMLDVQHTMNP
jgi:hypothetical protein